MKNALNPPDDLWMDHHNQIWLLNEWTALVAMLAGIASLLPFELLMLRTKFCSIFQGPVGGEFAGSWKGS